MLPAAGPPAWSSATASGPWPQGPGKAGDKVGSVPQTLQAGTLPLPVPAMEERKRILDTVKWEAQGDEAWGALKKMCLP